MVRSKADAPVEVKSYKLGKKVENSEWYIKKDDAHQGYFSLVSVSNEDLRMTIGGTEIQTIHPTKYSRNNDGSTERVCGTIEECAVEVKFACPNGYFIYSSL